MQEQETVPAPATTLAKIEHVSFGIAGYQDAMIGLHTTFSFEGGGVSNSKCWWDPATVERSEGAKWTEDQRSETHDELVRYVSGLLKDAKVRDVAKLKGVPVELTWNSHGFAGDTLKSWRILTEVL